MAGRLRESRTLRQIRVLARAYVVAKCYRYREYVAGLTAAKTRVHRCLASEGVSLKSENGIPKSPKACSDRLGSNQRTKPLFKWPGGKRWLIDELLQHVPDAFNTYHEPFAGGAALFFTLLPKRAFISDANAWLIESYIAVKEHPELVVAALRRLKAGKTHYYNVRDHWNPTSMTGRAAKLYYLQRFSFNGIYRENRLGEHNVPYGHRSHLDVVDSEHILAVSRALTGAILLHDGFSSVLDRAKAGDLVYMDPPYTVKHNNNGFIKYNASLYSWDSQTELAAVAIELRRRGCTVIVSNAYHQPLLRLFKKGFQIKRVSRHSVIGSKPDYRSWISEALIISV